MRTHRNSDTLDDRSAEALLASRTSGAAADADLASFVAELRSEYVRPTPVPVRTELAEVFASGLAGDRRDDSVPGSDPSEPRSRRRTVLTSLSAFVATLTGKILIGSAAVAAGVGSAHAAGVVDVPGLPDRPAAVDDVPADLPDGVPGSDRAEPDSPGVDGGEIADRATSGEPREDGGSFGSSVADEAVEGTPAEELRNGRGDVADSHRPDAPTGGSGIADEQRPDAPSDAADVAGNERPDVPTPGDGGDQPGQPSPGGADTDRSTPPTAAD